MKLMDLHTHHKKQASIINSYPFSFESQEGLVFSMGIHPWYATDKEEPYAWERMQEIVNEPSILAIGEVGLDKVRGGDIPTQIAVFRKQQELAEMLGKPLIIHCVRAFNEIIELKKDAKPKSPWIIHGFRGNVNIADQLLKNDFYLSFGEKYAIESLLHTPLTRIFLETDTSELDINFLYEKIAVDLKMPVNEFRIQIENNFRTLFPSLPLIY